MAKYIKGLVSVVIPTYKRSDLLMKAIASVLNQTYKNLELIVVNDNEVGDVYSSVLYERLNTISDTRLKFVEQEKHINGAAARNVGIRVAKGEYIAFQDDDDYWDNNKIERQVKLLSSLDESWGAVSCLKKLYSHGILKVASVPYKSGHIVTEILDGRISLGTGAVLIRRTALDKSGYFDESLNRHQDLQLFVRLASKYKIKLDLVYMQNREIGDEQNRPTANKLLSIKDAYFNSIKDIVERYPTRMQKRIKSIHYFEVATLYFKENNIWNGIKYTLPIFSSPMAVITVAVIMIKKIIGRTCKHYLVKKYDNLNTRS